MRYAAMIIKFVDRSVTLSKLPKEDARILDELHSNHYEHVPDVPYEPPYHLDLRITRHAVIEDSDFKKFAHD